MRVLTLTALMAGFLAAAAALSSGCGVANAQVTQPCPNATWTKKGCVTLAQIDAGPGTSIDGGMLAAAPIYGTGSAAAPIACRAAAAATPGCLFNDGGVQTIDGNKTLTGNTNFSAPMCLAVSQPLRFNASAACTTGPYVYAAGAGILRLGSGTGGEVWFDDVGFYPSSDATRSIGQGGLRFTTGNFSSAVSTAGNFTQTATTSGINNSASTTPVTVEDDDGLSVRNDADSADAPLSCSTATLSGNIVMSASGLYIQNSGSEVAVRDTDGFHVLDNAGSSFAPVAASEVQGTAVNVVKFGVGFDGDAADCPAGVCVLLDAYKVASVTWTSTGDYTVELTGPMSSAVYTPIVTSRTNAICGLNAITDADTFTIKCVDPTTGADADGQVFVVGFNLVP